mgnify:CR=1 FL=1
MPAKKRFRLILESAAHRSKPLLTMCGNPLSDTRVDLARLWMRVIIQGVRDAGSANQKTRAEVYRWINTTDYRKICSYVSIDAPLLKKGLLILIETAENFPRVVVVKSIEVLESELDAMVRK